MASILIVDDDQNICIVLSEMLGKAGYHVVTANDVDSAIPVIEEGTSNLIVTDLMMPGKSGMDLLTLSKEKKPATPVIMITAYGNIEAAVAAIKNGAFDFITKPFDEDELLNVIKKALAESEKNKELLSAFFEEEKHFLPDFIGRTPAIQEVFQKVRKVAPTDSTVLITGETGVGKELVARTIHLASHRRNHPFVKVNCAAIPETLMESELFGYEKGAFTGAASTKPGRFEIAHRGTLFLDEIGEIPTHLQVKLLTVLQDGAFERIGGVKNIKVDMRTVAATNKDLQEAVAAGDFRSDLFYRLNVVPLHVPPLRERKDDIFPQVEYFLEKFSIRYQRKITSISPEVMAAFTNYEWPGNTRELENVLERMVVLSEGDSLYLDEMPEEMGRPVSSKKTTTYKEKMDDIYRATDKQMILDALNKANQNRTEAARLLGISRRTLQNKIKEYDL